MLYRLHGTNYDSSSSGNKALSRFISVCAVMMCILILNYATASAGNIIIGQITPPGLAIQGIQGITFDRGANPLVLDGSGKTIWRLDLHDASVISTFPLLTGPRASRSLNFDRTTGRYFTSRRFVDGDYLSTVDPLSGNVTDIGVMGFSNWLDMAIHPITGDLWLVTDCVNTECTEGQGGTLEMVNKLTGALTPVQNFGKSLGHLTALAISPQGRFFVASANSAGFSSIYEIDPTSGESTFITETGLGFISFLMDMVFDSSTNRLYTE